MRKFLLRAHDLPTEFGFTLDNLPGNGRADLVARTVGSALLTSHGIRQDAEIVVSARDTAVRFRGSSMGGLNPDERSIAGVLQKAVNVYGSEWQSSTPGVESAEKSFAELVSELEGELVRLSSDGEPADAVGVPQDPVLAMSDHRQFEPEELKLLEDAREVSLGPEELQADQAAVMANAWIDTEGFSKF
jgi:tRNA (pseudouridine54-N1)-methyltransferase